MNSVEPLKIGAQMKIGLSGFAAWMIGVGSIVGSVAWLMHAPMLTRAGPLACLTAWIIAGIFSVPQLLILMEFASMFPTAGGPYVYKYYALKRLVPGMGEMLGFLTGWLFWIGIMVGQACMSNGLTNLVSSAVFGGVNASPMWIGPLLIVTLFGSTTALNFLSINSAAKASNAFTFMKFGMAFGFIGLVFFSGHWSMDNVLKVASPAGCTNFAANIGSVFMLAMSGFSFMEITGCTSSETADAPRSVPRAMFLTLLTVLFIYLAMCFSISAASPFVLNGDKTMIVAPGTSVQANCPAVAGLVGGPFCGNLFTACVVASIFGCGFTSLLGMARVTYSMAETRLFPRQFTNLHPRTRVPTYSLWFQFFVVTIIGIGANVASRTGAFPDAYAFLGDTFGFMYSFVAVLYGICIVSLRYTDPHLPRPFRIGKKGNSLVWAMSIITVTIWGYAAIGCVQWVAQLTGIIIALSGIPIYFYYKRTNQQAEEPKIEQAAQ